MDGLVTFNLDDVRDIGQAARRRMDGQATHAQDQTVYSMFCVILKMDTHSSITPEDCH